MNFETPEADAADQHRPVEEDLDEDEAEEVEEVELTDADPADLADQHRVVPDAEYDRG